MKVFAWLLFVLAFGADSAFRHMESEVRDRIVGTGKLLSAAETMHDRSARPFPAFGPQAKGFLRYQRDGSMCAVITNPHRYKRADPAQAAPEEKVAAADGTFSPCRRYEIDVKQQRILHPAGTGYRPRRCGIASLRPYRFAGGRLILGDVEKNDPPAARRKIAGGGGKAR